MVAGVPDLQKDLCNAIRIAQHAHVVEVSEEHLALPQGGIDLRAACKLARTSRRNVVPWCAPPPDGQCHPTRYL